METVSRVKLREEQQHGSPSFPMGLYRIRRDTELILHYHWHREFEFIFMSKGSAKIRTEDEWITLEAGEAVLIPGGVLHSGYSSDHHECEYFAVVFDSSLIPDGDDPIMGFITRILSGELGIERTFKPLTPWQGEVLGYLQGIISALSSGKPGCRMEARGYLLLCFARIMEYGIREQEGAPLRKPAAARNMHRFKTVIHHIHGHYGQRLSIPTLSGLVEMSTFHFCRFFKSMSGRTPTDYVNWYRIQRAAGFLESTAGNVMDIAFDCGFDNFSYFIKTFKRYKGLTPTEYRKNIMGADKPPDERGWEPSDPGTEQYGLSGIAP